MLLWMWVYKYLFEALIAEELMLLNCGVGEDSWKPLGLQGDSNSPSERRLVLSVHWKDWCWSWNSNIWPPDAKNWLIWKDPDTGKDWRQEEKWTTEDEIVGWHHQLDGCEVEKASGVGDGQGSLVCYIPWGRKESDMTEWLNWDKRQVPFFLFSPCKDNSLLKHYCCVVRTTSWMFWPLSSR